MIMYALVYSGDVRSIKSNTNSTPSKPIKSCGALGGLQLPESTAAPSTAAAVNAATKKRIDERLRFPGKTEIDTKHGDEK